MTEVLSSIDDSILDSVCVLVGPFKIPKTIGDLRVLLMQMTTSEYSEVHKQLKFAFRPYGENIRILEEKSADLVGEPHEVILDPDTRYIASQAINHLWHELSYERERPRHAAAPTLRQMFRRRVEVALKNLAASF